MSQHSWQDYDFDDDHDFDDVNESLPEAPTEKQIAHHKLCLKRWDDALKYFDTKSANHWSQKYNIRELMAKEEHPKCSERKMGDQKLIIDAFFQCPCKKRISLLNISDKKEHLTKCLDLQTVKEAVSVLLYV